MEMAFDAMEDCVPEEMEETIAIIKPDGVRQGGKVIGDILAMAADADLHPRSIWMGELAREVWEKFYAEHAEREFFGELVDFMSSGPSIFMVLRGKKAIATWRIVMGATDPLKASPGTIRRMFGRGGPANAVHGSDSAESFKREWDLIFRGVRMIATDG